MIQLDHYQTMAKMKKFKAEDTIVFLCGVSYENFGLILRSADAFGVKKAIYFGELPEKFEKIRKISRNSSVLTEFTDNIDGLDVLKKDGYFLAALEITDEAEPICQIPPHGKLCLIIGNEQNGVPQSILDLCDHAYYIEMAARSVSSLNVAVATSIALSRRLELSNLA